MRSSRVRILAYLGSEVLIVVGTLFAMSMTLGVTNCLPPARLTGVVAFSLLAAFLSILTQVIMFGKRDRVQATMINSQRKPEIGALCEHLRQIGLNATMESKQQVQGFSVVALAVYGVFFLMIFFAFVFVFIGLPVLVMAVAKMPMVTVGLLLGSGGLLCAPALGLLYVDPPHMETSIMGSVRVANQNIDAVELEKVSGSVLKKEFPIDPDESIFDYVQRYRCNYVVKVKVKGWELEARAKPVTVKKGFLSREIVDFGWEGWELAQVLNGDAGLREKLYHTKDKFFFFLEIRPDRKHECVRIRPRGGYELPKSAFPTIETLETLESIAQHIHSVAANTRKARVGATL